MKTLTVSDARDQLSQLLAEAARGDVIVLTDGNIEVTLTPRFTVKPLNPEEDTPELEAALLKAIDGPFTPYSSEEMRATVDCIIREEKRR